MGSASGVEAALAEWQSPADPLCHSLQRAPAACAAPTQRHTIQSALELSDQTMASYMGCKTAWPAVPHDGTFYPLWLMRELRLIVKRRGYAHTFDGSAKATSAAPGQGAPAAA